MSDLVLKDLASLDGVYKIAAGDMLGRLLRDSEATTNAGRMSARVVISTGDEDRSGDIVVQKGIRLENHQRNPVVLLAHDKDALIGMAEDREGRYMVGLEGNRLRGEVYFNQSSELGHQAFRLVESKALRAASIGFLPVHGKIEKRSPRGHVYHEADMVEFSLLPIGDNQHAVIEAVHKGFGGKPLTKPLLDLLTPLVPDRAASVVGGYERHKAMQDPNLAGGNVEPNPMEPQPTDGTDTAGGASHKDVVDQSMGQILESIWMEYMSGQLDPKAAKKEFAKVVDSHQSHAAVGDVSGDVDGEMDDLDTDDVTEDGVETDDVADEDVDDYEDDVGDEDGPPVKGKKKHILAYTEKSVEAGAALHTFATEGIDGIPRIMEPLRKTLDVVVQAVDEGKVLNHARLADVVRKALARSDAAYAKIVAKRDAVLDLGATHFGPIKKALRTGAIKTKGAPVVVPAEEISDEVLDMAAGVLINARTELYELTGR